MATKNISDWQVCAAVYDMRQRQLNGESSALAGQVVIEILQTTTGAPKKVCERALERAFRHGLVEAGMWFHGGWLTHDGILLLYLNDGQH